MDLPAAWLRTCRSAGAAADDALVAAAGDALIARWREPHRRYHDADHLVEVLEGVDALEAAAADPGAVRLAAWFHDAVYDGRPGDDERRSAELAVEVLTGLGVPQERVGEVARLVRVTEHHQPPSGDPDGAVLCDADLAILAADVDRYQRYVAAVRAEYAHVPEGLFRQGRATVLRALEAMPRLYRTEAGRERWEAAARANLARELSELSV